MKLCTVDNMTPEGSKHTGQMLQPGARQAWVLYRWGWFNQRQHSLCNVIYQSVKIGRAHIE